MTKTELRIYSELKDVNRICFGPIVSDFGWEISYIAEFIKKYKKDNPNKLVCVATRRNRKELYENSDLDDIFTFDIEGDYHTVTQRTHSLYTTDPNNINYPLALDVKSKFSYVKDEVSKKHKNISFYSFTKLSFSIVPEFSLKNFSYDYKPHSENHDVINSIIEKNPGKKIVTIFSRERIDLQHRNLGRERWEYILQRLSSLDKTHVFLIAGVSPAYVKALPEYTNMYNLEEFCDGKPNSNVTILGLMIEAIRNSRFVFGPQTAGILMSTAMRVPALYYGTDYNIVSVNYNPFKTQTEYVQVRVKQPSGEYDIDPEQLVQRIINMKVAPLEQSNKFTEDLRPHTTDMEYIIPTTHPHLDGLTDAQKIKRIRELNANPSKSIPNLIPVVQDKLVDTILKK